MSEDKVKWYVQLIVRAWFNTVDLLKIPISLPFPLTCSKIEPVTFLFLFFQCLHAAFFSTAFKCHMFFNLGFGMDNKHTR